MASRVRLGAVGDVAASHHGVFTRIQAAELGVNAKVLASLIRREVLSEPAPGLLVVRGSAPTFDRLATAASLLAGDRGVLADGTSAWIHRLDHLDRAPDVATLAVARGTRISVGELPIIVRSCRAGIDPRDVVAVGNWRVTGLARTVCDLAAASTPGTVERLVDDFERRGLSLAWLQTTATRLQQRGRAGPGAVLAELEARRARRDSGREGRVRGSWFQKLVAECLASPRLPGLVEEYEIRDDRGRLVARCDLAVPAVRLGVEAHSRRFHTGGRAEAADERRDNRVAEAGWDLRYLGWADTTETPGRTRAYLERLVGRRAADLGVVL